ncbi:MAG: thioredoxin-disulfide reductase [Methanosphaera sp. rholeuAM6]|nr:MAG: thioredoxin-disulfide reductase [Methanosphaera sp. rholeuAM6]
MYDLIIIGAGPAGLTAGIYAGRAGLDTLILDKSPCGGTANNAPLVENYPGFDKIPGMELMKSMAQQAKKYCEVMEFVTVEKVEKSIGHSFNLTTSKGKFTTQYVILATGCNHKTLDVPGVEEFTGRGVSYCAVCDGCFFIGQEVIIVGGGNSAATEALYLNRIGVKCSIVHRRDWLRCDIKLQEDLANNNVNIYWDSELKEVKGDVKVEEAVIYNKKTGEERTLKVSGVFLAIGNEPNSQLARDLEDVEIDDFGYIPVNENMETELEGVYAVGDVNGGVKQIVVAAGQAATAVERIQYLLF